MLGFFRKKPANPFRQMLQLSNAAFVEAVRYSVVVQEPAVSAMIVVAMMNLNPSLAAMFNLAKEHPGEGLPTNLDEFIVWASDAIERTRGEVGKKRLMWFVNAALVKRATVLAEQDRCLEDDVVQVWLRLIEGGRHIQALLKHNVLWKPDEKLWFSDLKSETDNMSYAANFVMPKWMRQNSSIKSFASEHDFFTFWPAPNLKAMSKSFTPL